MSEHEHGALHSSVGPTTEPVRPHARLPRLLHLWARVTRGLTLGVRAAVFDNDGRVLLVRHTYVTGWSLPGGGVEPGETAQTALERELREETGVHLTGPARLHGLFLNRNLAARDHVAVYVARDFTRAEISLPNREIAQIGFFDISALPEATTPATRRRLAEIAGQQAVEAHW